MADIRINALTEASASVTTDFLPIDGSTGTRKLSAFNPSFGGNATVGGTLTVNGTGNSTFAGSVIVRRDQAAITALTVDNQNTGGTTNLFLTEDAGSANYFRIFRSGSTTATPNVVNISNVAGGVASTTAIEFGNPVKVNATTASTTTSSGALVVGNGTSGGLGVGGAIYAGGDLYVANGISTAAAQVQIGNGRSGSGYAIVDLVGDTTYTDYGTRIIRGNSGANATSSLEHRGTGDLSLVATDAAAIKFYTNGNLALTVAATTGSATFGSALTVIGQANFPNGTVQMSNGREFQLQYNANTLTLRDNTAGNNPFTANGSTSTFTIGYSTASTGTSSGALVVSGGVGVAGAIYAGGDVVSTGSAAQEIVCESTTGANYAGVISKNNSGNTFNLYSLGSTYGGTVFGGVSGNNQAVLEGSASISSICISHANPTGKIIIAPNRTNALMVENSLVTVASGVDLKLGNAYTAGAPTATGYIVIKDSTGTSYKIPAVAL